MYLNINNCKMQITRLCLENSGVPSIDRSLYAMILKINNIRTFNRV